MSTFLDHTFVQSRMGMSKMSLYGSSSLIGTVMVLWI